MTRIKIKLNRKEIDEDRNDTTIERLEKDIEEYEKLMFGVMLYQQTTPKLIQIIQKISYDNMRRRGEDAIQKAKSILNTLKKQKKGEKVKVDNN